MTRATNILLVGPPGVGKTTVVMRLAAQLKGRAVGGFYTQEIRQAGGRLETVTDQDGLPKPLSTSYPARAPVDDPQERILLGLRGRAKIRAAPRTLGDRLYRYVIETFRFHL